MEESNSGGPLDEDTPKHKLVPPTVEDMPKRSLDAISRALKEYGNTATDRVQPTLDRFAAIRDDPSNKDAARKGASKNYDKLSEIGPHIKNIPITLTRAANSRAGLVDEAVTRAHVEGQPVRGGDWYYQHNKGLRDAAPGRDIHVLAAASAALSVKSSPMMEVRNLRSIHEALSDPDATVWHAGMGKHLKVSETSSDTLGATDISKSMSLGTTRAIQVLRGEVHHSELNKGPKLKSYQHNIANSMWGSLQHEDAITRARQLTGDRNQGSLSFTQAEGLGSYEEGLDKSNRPEGFTPTQRIVRSRSSNPIEPIPKDSTLSPHGATAEDSWQGADTTGQKRYIPPQGGRGGRGTALAKKASDSKFPLDYQQPSDMAVLQVGIRQGVPEVPTGSDALHAFNNLATRRGGEIVGAVTFNQYGEDVHLPASATQGIGWEENRIQSRSGDDYVREIKQEHKDLNHLKKTDPTSYYNHLHDTAYLEIAHPPAAEPSRASMRSGVLESDMTSIKSKLNPDQLGLF